MTQDATQRRTLGDILAERIREEEKAALRKEEADERKLAAGITPKVERVFSEVGKFLTTYKSGKLPKVFKVLPNLDAWEEVSAACGMEGGVVVRCGVGSPCSRVVG
jgi:essential nuclear protein 1